MEVKKSSGLFEEFSADKVKSGIYAAFKKSKQPYNEEIGEDICNSLSLYGGISTKEIRDQVEELLMDYSKKAAKAYIAYGEDDAFLKDREKYMEDYVDTTDNAATASETDPNANMSQKSVASLEGEVFKTKNRNLQRKRMKNKLHELYPEVANNYKEDLEEGIIYTHDEASSPALKYYCQAVSLYPLMAGGVGNLDGVTPSAPNDLQSFSGQLTNATFLLSAQCKGAVALGEYQIALIYYIRMEYGKDWVKHIDDVVSTGPCQKEKTVRSEIKKAIKQFIYGVNQPAGNRNSNSPFTNISIYDHTYFDALFKDFYYPDGTQCTWEEVDCVQRIILKLRRDLNLIKPLTFPVTTIAVVNDGKDIIDQDYKKLCAEEWSKGSSHFLYNSNNPSSLASCCFSKDQKVLWKSSTSGVNLTTLKELYDLPWEPAKKNLKIFHNGSWVSGKAIELPNRDMYRVITSNNKELVMTDNHINVTLDGEKTTDKLTTDDYLMFNTMELNAIPENDEHLTYDQGFIVGAFLGDGSFGSEIRGTVYDIIYSQNENKYQELLERLERANNQLGGSNAPRLGSVHNNVYPVRLSSKETAAFIMRWTNWRRGTYAFNKELNLNCLLQSVEFRKGILDGWYNTDGGNSNRCYTTSPKLAEDMEVLITSLGMQSIIDISDRTDEKVIIRGEEYDRNYPLYCVRWYEPANHRINKNPDHTWIKKNNSIYFKIKSIEKVEYTDNVYCIECKNEKEPYFTLPSGLITHNCRVLNEITENTFSSVNGLQGIMTGSCNVITLNINRITQKYIREQHPDYIEEDGRVHRKFTEEDKQGFKNYLINILERVYKYHIAFKTMLYDLEDKKMFASSNGGYIFMKKLYSTIGHIGYQEAAMFLGFEPTKNDDYIEFLQIFLSTIEEQNKLHSIKDKKRPFLFNSEAIPGENLAVKYYQKDKKDGYYVPADRNLYSSYFFNPWDNKVSVLDKMYLHGECTSAYTSGGQACHLNMLEDLSFEQYMKLIDYSTANKTSYWTINRPVSVCLDCSHVVNGPAEVCPVCGSHNMDWWIRIIGYLRPLSAYSKERFKEAKKRVFHKKDEEDIV